MTESPVYRATVWEADDGWHWRVEIDVRNGRAWNGVCESFTVAAKTAAQFLRSTNAGLEQPPTAPQVTEEMKLLTHSPNDYRAAPSGEGPLKREWRDKPHRLIYDLVGEVERLRADNQALSDRIAADYQEKADLSAALRAALGSEEGPSSKQEPHEGYADYTVDGYHGACHTCPWTGPLHPLGQDGKLAARHDATVHEKGEEPVSEPRDHIEDASALRAYLLERHRTDWGLSDDMLAVAIRRAKATAGGVGWEEVAAENLHAAFGPPPGSEEGR